MVASIAKGTSARYYLRQAEYYLSGREPAGIWLSTSSALGITAGDQVDAELFEKLHEGLGSDGKALLTNDGGRNDRVSGYDITLSAPKSVSILYALADSTTRAAIEQVQLEASRAVLAVLDNEAAFTRRGKAGAIIEKASLVVAAFQHGEARPSAHSDGRVFADMALHTHLCVANVSERPRDAPNEKVSFGALDGRALYAHAMLAGSVYHLSLSSGLKRLGFSVEVTGRNGIFELISPTGGPAVDEATTRYFSSRRNTIEDRLAEYDLVTGEARSLAAAVARATRLSKADSNQDRFEQWAERAAAQGVDVPTFAHRLRRHDRQHEQVPEQLIAQRLAQLPRSLTEHESVFERRTLLAAVASALVGTGVGLDRANAEVDRLITSQQIVPLSHDIYGHGLYSTPELIAIERNLLTIAQMQGARRWSSADRDYIERECRRRGLSDEQRIAVHAATGTESLVIIEGSPGVGKTVAMKLIKDGYEGKKILAGAMAWRTARMLQEDLGVTALAIDSLLARINAGQQLLDKDTLLLIDECGQIGSRTMKQLLLAARDAQSKVVLVGDRQQLQPISAGAALKILTSALAPTRMEKIVRQREQWAQLAAMAFAKGDAAAGLAAYSENGLLHGCTGAKATITAAVDQYMAAKRDNPAHPHLLIAKSNKVVRALNVEVRRRMRAESSLVGPDYTIAASDSSGRAFTLSLAVGDSIRFGVRQDAIGDGVINGTVGRIENVREVDGGHLAITAMIDQKRVSFSTKQLHDKTGRIRMSHNIASTAYSSQGLTAETATVVLDAGFDRHDSLVAMSRSRGNTSIFYDTDLLGAQMKATQDLGSKTLETSEEERLSFMARSIARANLKTSTLAFEHHGSRNTHRVAENTRGNAERTR
ncbi:MobF family relaxase [Bradyrhizobium genosp. A]|uniref:MobF family relaxase n=1 Tax=Bradyrhizobium genosp. A TaxID=83626 RepID=UPI003CF4366B